MALGEERGKEARAQGRKEKKKRGVEIRLTFPSGGKEATYHGRKKDSDIKAYIIKEGGRKLGI